MKTIDQRIIEIILSLIMTVCLFMPFAYNITPFAYSFSASLTVTGMVMISIPVSSIFLLLLYLVFLKMFSGRFLRILKFIFILAYFVVLGFYLMTLFDNIQKNLFIMPIIASALLFSVTLFFKVNNSVLLQNTLLAVITLPLIFHMPFLFINMHLMNYGGWIMEGAFVLLYLFGFVRFIKSKEFSKRY